MKQNGSFGKKEMEKIIVEAGGGAIYSLLLEGLLCGLGLGARHLLGGGGLDHTHRHCLPHVADCEPNNLTRRITYRLRLCDSKYIYPALETT